MSVDVTQKGPLNLLPGIASEIFNGLNSGVLVFGSDKSVKDINQIGLNIINGIYPEINSLEQAQELTLDRIFTETNFPGWLNKFEYYLNASDEWLNEYLNAPIDGKNKIYSVNAGKVSSESNGSLFVVTLKDITHEKESQHRFAWIEKQDEKGSMASIIVHDLNNYLSLLLGGAELTELAMCKGNTEKAEATLGKLKANVRKMEKFIAAFTDEYKIETCMQKTDINSLISNVVSYLSTQERFIDITIITRLDSQVPEFEFDIDQLSRLILNFLYNSCDAIGESDTKQGLITIKTEFDIDKVVLTISDNGIGLTEDVKEKLFRRRFTTKKNHTGYGLMGCGCIVENHKGQVEIVDDVDEGAAFRVILPLT